MVSSLANPLLRVENLVRRFGGILATDNLSLDVAAGELHAIIGPNGAGKTTLISQLTGQLMPNSGAIHFAGRFASKEAAMKALGTGHSQGVLWRDIEVVRRPGGPPQLKLHGGAARRFEKIGGRTAQLSISHTDTLAFAQAIILGE